MGATTWSWGEIERVLRAHQWEDEWQTCSCGAAFEPAAFEGRHYVSEHDRWLAHVQARLSD